MPIPNFARQRFYRSVTGASIITARQSQFGGAHAGGTGSKCILATCIYAAFTILQTHTLTHFQSHKHISYFRLMVPCWLVVEGCTLTLII